ncbi:sulfurtransferase [Propionivibrio sp.]|uniref:sulfurtransferase n=1 Tax=Propionivibrio sp. TaxID=2212460 RepID=UPI003BEFF0E8
MSFTTLLSCDELAEHLNDQNWRVFDCRHQLSDVAYGEKSYAEGHLPGAFFLHLDRDLSGPMNGRNGRHPLPDAVLLANKLGASGVSRETQVVVYDDGDGMIAGRLWWLLRWFGHDRVALLDGGIRQWVKAGRPLTTDLPEPAATVFAVDMNLRDWVVRTEDVLANLDRNELCLVDARDPDRFRGENETLDPVGGHIPGARNRFFRDNLDAEGCFRLPAELRREFLGLLAGVEPAQAVMQCGSGVTACHNLLAMEIAGLQGAKLYAGSWSEWCADPARPVAC